jgi:hypothetical protein
MSDSHDAFLETRDDREVAALRDRFALAVLTGLLAGNSGAWLMRPLPGQPTLAETVWRITDEVLKTRNTEGR